MRTANYATNQPRITQLRHELSEARAAKKALTRLSLEDHENCSDNYQEHLELGYEIEGLEEEIKALEKEQ